MRTGRKTGLSSQDAFDDVDGQKGRVEAALAAIPEPLAVAEECLANRNQRQGKDRVDDNVQKHLGFEIETMQNSQVSTSGEISSDREHFQTV